MLLHLQISLRNVLYNFSVTVEQEKNLEHEKHRNRRP